MPTQKIDPKVIFASDAPTIDKPPVFSDKTKGWDVSRANDGRPTIKEMNKVQQDTDLKILWLNENSVTPYDESIDYPDGAVAIKDGSFKQLASGSWVEFLDDFADKTYTDSQLLLKADKTYVDNQLALKADKAEVNKFYPTLAEANADITNITVNQPVNISESQNFGLWYKATAGATSLTKSPYDPLTQAKADATTKANAAEANAKEYTDDTHSKTMDYINTNLASYLPTPTQDFGYVNITEVGDIDYIKKLQIEGNWVEGSIFLGQDYLTKLTDRFELGFISSSGGWRAYLDITEPDRTGVKTYDLLPIGDTRIYTGKIQIDWDKRPDVVTHLKDGALKNYYVKNIAKNNFLISENDVVKESVMQTIDLFDTVLNQKLLPYIESIAQDFGYVSGLVGESDFIKHLYIEGPWEARKLFFNLDWLNRSINRYEISFSNTGGTKLAYLDITEPDRTGVKTYDLLPIGDTKIYTGKIQIDWDKRADVVSAVVDGAASNHFIKEAARQDFTLTVAALHEKDQDAKLTWLEKTVKSNEHKQTYSRYKSLIISNEGFSITGGWSISSGVATTNTPSETDKIYTKQKYISNKIQHRWTITLQSNSVVKLGGYGGSANIESTCIIDCVSKTLIINKRNDNTSNPTTPRAIKPIPFNIIDGRDYYVTLFRNGRKNSIKLTDAVTGESVTLEDNWSLGTYGSGSGNMRSLMYVTMAAGTSLTVKKYENYLPKGVDVVFGGDSNTESSIDYSGVHQVNWADNLMEDVFNHNGVKFAEYGIQFPAWWNCIGEVIAMKPKFFIVNIGTNSATTQSQYQQIADICASNDIELILCHNPRTDGSKLHVPQNNLNMDAVPDVQIVKFDVATSLNYDLNQAYNSALFTDGVHLNTAGYRVLSDRVLADVQILKSS